VNFFKETTVWPSGGSNHTYLLTQDKTKMVAFVSAGQDKVFTFMRPIPFYVRGRTFLQVSNSFGYKLPDSEPTAKILGSKGAVYHVTKKSGVLRCSCPGFAFRAKCKHTEEGGLLLSQVVV
jgi:hypothetical protein